MTARFDSVVEPDHPRDLLPQHAAKIQHRKNGCWIWTGSIGAGGTGYGLLTYRRVGFRAHRFIYEWLVGPIPDDRELDHICRISRCVNPAHLEPVTHAENVARGNAPAAIAHRSKRCVADLHDLIGRNIYVNPNGRGIECRACRNERTRRHDSRKALADV